MNSKALWNASKVFAPDFPRRSSDDGTFQSRRASRGEFVAALEAAARNEMPGYYSVYSFPRGHSQEGEIPKIDCIFIDLDVTNEQYQPNPNKQHYDVSLDSWRVDMSALLARARMIADTILDTGQEDHFRVALSGHKGIHLYLDFHEVAVENGDIGMFKNGLSTYCESLMEWLDEMAGGVNIMPWVDVDGSDLARLARHPNTPHHGAAYDDVQRWCVAVTVDELASLTVDDYLSLTSQPRPLPDDYQRVPSKRAHDRVVQQIRGASSSSRSTTPSRRSQPKSLALEKYRESSNDEIELDDVLFLTANKPCIKAFRQRDDAYNYGDASRAMELSIMGRFIEIGTPIEVMHEFFSTIPGYSESYTTDMIADLLARDNQYGEFRCATICGGVADDGKRISAKAPQFCLHDGCSIYNRSSDLR